MNRWVAVLLILIPVAPARGQDSSETNRKVLEILERLDRRLDDHDRRLDRSDAEIAQLKRELQELRTQLAKKETSKKETRLDTKSFPIDGKRFTFDWSTNTLYDLGEPVDLARHPLDNGRVQRLNKPSRTTSTARTCGAT